MWMIIVLAAKSTAGTKKVRLKSLNQRWENCITMKVIQDDLIEGYGLDSQNT